MRLVHGLEITADAIVHTIVIAGLPGTEATREMTSHQNERGVI